MDRQFGTLLSKLSNYAQSSRVSKHPSDTQGAIPVDEIKKHSEHLNRATGSAFGTRACIPPRTRMDEGRSSHHVDSHHVDSHGGQEYGIGSTADVSTASFHAGQQPARRSSRSVVKPDFRALENGGAETEELLDELGIGGEDMSESIGYNGQQGRKRRGSGRKGSVHGGLSKGGRVRKPAMLEDMEMFASKLEDEVARLEEEVDALTGRYNSLRRENALLGEKVHQPPF